jgi:hypothetical protein
MYKLHNGRVRIKNKTNYNTLEIRKYFNIVADLVGVEKKGYLVYVERVKTKRQRVLGRGWINQSCIRLYLQKDKQDITSLMAVIEHELLHNLGNRHDVMKCSHWIDVKKWESYSGFITEEVKEKKPIDLRQMRYERILMRLSSYTAKLKRVENLVKKYESKKKYYDKILTKTTSQ